VPLAARPRSSWSRWAPGVGCGSAPQPCVSAVPRVSAADFGHFQVDPDVRCAPAGSAVTGIRSPRAPRSAYLARARASRARLRGSVLAGRRSTPPTSRARNWACAADVNPESIALVPGYGRSPSRSASWHWSTSSIPSCGGVGRARRARRRVVWDRCAPLRGGASGAPYRPAVAESSRPTRHARGRVGAAVAARELT